MYMLKNLWFEVNTGRSLTNYHYGQNRLILIKIFSFMDAALHELQQCGPFLWAAVLQKLLWHRSFPWDAVLQKQTAPVWVPHGPQILPVSFTDNLPQRGLLSTGFSFLQDISTCCGMVSSMGCSVNICSDVVHHGLQGDNHHSHSPLYELQRNLSSGAWSTSSFLTDLDVCRVVSLTILFSLTAAAWHFPAFIKYVIFEVQQVLPIVSALACGGPLLEPVETGSIQ